VDRAEVVGEGGRDIIGIGAIMRVLRVRAEDITGDEFKGSPHRHPRPVTLLGICNCMEKRMRRKKFDGNDEPKNAQQTKGMEQKEIKQ